LALTITPVTDDLIEDLGRLFSTDRVADDCWCMWFIIPVKEYHAAGHAGNRAALCEVVAQGGLPPGLLAFQAGEPVGWCAVGPRSRYVRALKTATYREAEAESDADAYGWCHVSSCGRRERGGVSRAPEAAVELARKNGAIAIEVSRFRQPETLKR
jgi:hypothetical protein